MVNRATPSAGSNHSVARAHPPPAEGTAAQIYRLAELSALACDGAACAIAWQGAAAASTARAAADPRLAVLLDLMLAAVERDPRYHTHRGDGMLRFGRSELAAACGTRVHAVTCAGVAAGAGGDAPGAIRATVVLAAPGNRPARGLAAAAELAAGAVLALLGANGANSSRDFWRKRAGDTAERLIRSRSETMQEAAERSRIERAAAAAAKLHGRNRLASLAALFARVGSFDAWIMALAENERLQIAASAGILMPADATLGEGSGPSAMGECFARQVRMVRRSQRGRPAAFAEDRIFARFDGYICLPFERGAIALAAEAMPDEATLARVEALATRLNPLVSQWLLAAETDRLQRLVRNLGLRMFGAIDAERARIARDLHDHQAQLLAAARIGIEAGPDEARGILKQLEDALRLRVRELKPPSLGRSTLAEGLRYELRRLADAGIKGRLMHADRMQTLTRPVQQVCYQVAREALANVIRHAAASRVEISIEKRGERVRLSILDNGRGIAAAADRGIGLNGLSERLELMGGRLRVESKPGATRLVAEIPEPA